jgi:hypothetical protein
MSVKDVPKCEKSKKALKSTLKGMKLSLLRVSLASAVTFSNITNSITD